MSAIKQTKRPKAQVTRFDFARRVKAPLKTMVKALYPNKVTYVCSLDVLTMHSEWLMNRIGIIFKRKFIQDVHLLKNMKHSVM